MRMWSLTLRCVIGATMMAVLRVVLDAGLGTLTLGDNPRLGLGHSLTVAHGRDVSDAVRRIPSGRCSHRRCNDHPQR